MSPLHITECRRRHVEILNYLSKGVQASDPLLMGKTLARCTGDL
jgi:hypothetical protein